MTIEVSHQQYQPKQVTSNICGGPSLIDIVVSTILIWKQIVHEVI